MCVRGPVCLHVCVCVCAGCGTEEEGEGCCGRPVDML